MIFDDAVREPEDQEPIADAEVRFQAGIRARRLEKLQALRRARGGAVSGPL